MKTLLLVVLCVGCGVDTIGIPFGGATFPDAGLARGGDAGAGGAGGVGGAGGGVVVSTGGVLGTGGVVSTGGSIVSTGGAIVSTGGSIVSTGGVVGTGGAATGGMVVASSGGAAGMNGMPSTTCASGTVATNDVNDENHRPGSKCRSCHLFTVSGTVYSDPHAKQDCYGVPGNAGVSVLIADAAGKVLSLRPNAVGNFYTDQAFTFPVTVATLYGSQRIEMAAKVGTDARDCNSCHDDRMRITVP